jgi:predicted dienelactone hydrolase
VDAGFYFHWVAGGSFVYAGDGGGGSEVIEPTQAQIDLETAYAECNAWIEAAMSVRNTCRNLPEFDALIETQRRRLADAADIRASLKDKP